MGEVRHIELHNISDGQLIKMRLAVEAEMRKRGLPLDVGEIGEEVAISYFNSTPGLPTLKSAPGGTKNVDALSKDGDRYSIKTLLKAKKTGTVYPDKENPNKQLFEYMLFVKLNDDFSLKSMYRFSWTQFLAARSWDKRMSAWYVSASGRAMAQGERIV